jgi:hypothetical protein
MPAMGNTPVSFEEISTLVGLCLTLLTLVGTVFWYVHSGLRAVEKAAAQKVELEIAREAKTRHDLANSWTATFGEYKRAFDTLNMDAARKSDLDKVEERLTLAINKNQDKTDKVLEKMAGELSSINSSLIRLTALSDARQKLNDKAVLDLASTIKDQ